jgi:hypothetical protein
MPGEPGALSTGTKFFCHLYEKDQYVIEKEKMKTYLFVKTRLLQGLRWFMMFGLPFFYRSPSPDLNTGS